MTASTSSPPPTSTARPTTSAASSTRRTRHGIGVILDVVYNHLGPVGNFLKDSRPDYFSDRYCTEWGEALNFDGPNSGPVREFIVANAGYWVDEFHFDGLRIDATQSIFDVGVGHEHILAEITRRAREAAARRAGSSSSARTSPRHVRLHPAPRAGRLRPRRARGTTTSTTAPSWR